MKTILSLWAVLCLINLCEPMDRYRNKLSSSNTIQWHFGNGTAEGFLRFLQLLPSDLDFMTTVCYKALTCIHTANEKCGIDGSGNYRRFYDTCDVLEFNCLKGTDYTKTANKNCNGLPPIDDDTQAPQSKGNTKQKENSGNKGKGGIDGEVIIHNYNKGGSGADDDTSVDEQIQEDEYGSVERQTEVNDSTFDSTQYQNEDQGQSQKSDETGIEGQIQIDEDGQIEGEIQIDESIINKGGQDEIQATIEFDSSQGQQGYDDDFEQGQLGQENEDSAQGQIGYEDAASGDTYQIQDDYDGNEKQVPEKKS